jgi:hypothetical protein
MLLGAGCGSQEDARSLGWQELQNLSQFEREALRDKHVEPTELDRATQVYVGCLSGAGVRAMQTDPKRPGPAGVVTEFEAASDKEENQKNTAIASCLAEVSAVQAVWTMENQSSEEEKQAAKESYVDCVRDAGLELAEGASFEEAHRSAGDAVSKPRAAPRALGPEAENPDRDGVDTEALNLCARTVSAVFVTPLPGLAESLEELSID